MAGDTLRAEMRAKVLNQLKSLPRPHKEGEWQKRVRISWEGFRMWKYRGMPRRLPFPSPTHLSSDGTKKCAKEPIRGIGEVV